MAPHTQPNTRLDQKQSPRRRAQEGAGKKRTTMHHSPAFRNDLSAGHAEGVESKVATWASRLPNCCCSPHGFCIQFSNALPLYQANGTHVTNQPRRTSLRLHRVRCTCEPKACGRKSFLIHAEARPQSPRRTTSRRTTRFANHE